MHSRAITDPQDPSDSDDFSLSGNAIYASLAPWLGGEAGGASSASAAAGAGSGSPGSVVAVAAGGITINLLFDAAAMAAPASFRAGIQQAAAILGATISDQITVNLTIHYTGTGGGAFAGPDWGQWETYSSVRADLINNATAGDATFNALPSGSSDQGQTSVAVWNAQLKLWGLLGANDTTTDDGSATFATDINPNLLVGVALHELTHALGRIPYGSQPDIFDLFRFTSPGVQLFQGGATAPAAYFSVDGGFTKLADLGQNSDPSDFLNSGVQGPNDPFNEFYTGSTSQSLTVVDKEILDALGFHTAAPVVTTVLEAFGSTNLVEVGNNFFLDNISSGTGPELKYQGAPVVTGAAMYGGYLPIGAEQTAGGYEIAWKVAGADQYTVWNVDSNGNYVSNLILATSGTSFAIENVETSFHQDLNGDGVIGVVGFTTATLVPADFDDNGHDDILWNNDNGAVSIWDNGQIGGAHGISNPGVVPSSSHISGTGDFDGNGHDDILWRSDDGAVFIWDNGQASGAHTTAAAGVVPASWHIAGVGDFDGNGHADILWQNDNGAVSIWDNGQISGAHGISGPGAVPSSWHIAGVGDFDGNGRADILWQNDNGAVSIWDNGQINSAHWISGPGVVSSSWHIAGVGDFDGNGHTDILWHNDNGAVSIWDNGQIGTAHIIANGGVVPSGWHIA